MNAAQKRLVKSKIVPYSILKGAYGSGKTTAAVYRVIYLKNNYCLYENDKILITSHNEQNIDKLKYLYKIYNQESKLDYITLFSNQEHKIYFFTIDNLINKYFLQFKKENSLNIELINNKSKKNEIIKKCIDRVQPSYPNLKILNYKYIDFIIDEISWIKSCNYVKLDTYQNIDRIGRKYKKGNGPQRLLKNSNEREAIFKIMLSYDKILKENNLVDDESKVFLALKQARANKMDKYAHIIVDGSEKLTKIQIDFVDALKNSQSYSSVIFIMNTDKNIYDNTWFRKGRPMSKLNLGFKPKSYCFKQSYIGNYTNSIETFKYYDLRHRKDFEFMRDENNISDIILSDKDGGSEFIKEELKEIPVYNDIAAGEPIYMNSEVEGTFFMPKCWLKGMKDCFILKIKGDSMINVNINDGDHVVIRKQPFAENNDIVAADLDGSATLKRLKIRKNSAVLMPENDKYKPIPIGEEGVRIIGVAVGILKHI